MAEKVCNIFAILLGWTENQARVLWNDFLHNGRNLIAVSLLHLRGVLPKKQAMTIEIKTKESNILCKTWNGQIGVCLPDRERMN
jgi:hypothetical protein